ncbi:MAG: TonB-dependent receptor [Bacteroidota bacterium]
MKKSFVILLLSVGSFYHQANAQEEVDLFEMSLEELMDVEIVSASKKSENLFDAPVSSYSITRDEISKAGATSIPEALRLCPGVIVREMTNGNYDIHLRGFDNVIRYGTATQINYQTLLMIDNRPVFNYTYGGVFWEALPVDIIDVERIEIVRGPSAPLFGPNAVTGVINIITRKIDKEGWYSNANVQYGLPETLIGNMAVGKQFDKTSIIISGNYQDRSRHDDLYYELEGDQYLENIDGIPDAEVYYPEPELALRKFGVNAFINHKVSDDVSFDLSAGMHEAEVQRRFTNSITSLGFNGNSSRYVNLAGNVYGFGAKISYTNGFDNLSYDANPTVILKYDSHIIDVVLDYQWQVTDKLQIRPLFNFQSATYDDSEYLGEALLGGLFNESVNVNGIAGSLRADYQLTDAWRLVGSVRADKFAKPDDIYISYQFASTYKVSEDLLFRAAYSKSSSSAFTINTSANLVADIDLGLAGPGTGPIFRQSFLGNPNANLLTSNMAEVGMRAKISDNFQVELELFQQQMQDLATFVITEQTFTPTGLPAPFPPAVPATDIQSVRNLPIEALQRGVTLSANFVPSSKFQIKPFVTIQETTVENLPLALNTLPEDPNTNPFNLTNGIDEEHVSTPRVYGGAFLNGAITSKLNANVSAYFFSAHTQFDAIDADLTRNSTVGEIDSKVLINSKISYRLIDQLQVHVNVRNLLGNDSREYYGTDRIGRTIFLGVNFSL